MTEQDSGNPKKRALGWVGIPSHKGAADVVIAQTNKLIDARLDEILIRRRLLRFVSGLRRRTGGESS